MRSRRTTITVIAAATVATVIGLVVPAAVAGEDPRARKHRIDSAVATLRTEVRSSAAKVATATMSLEAADAALPVARAALARAQDTLRVARSSATQADARVGSTLLESVRTARIHDHIEEDLRGHHRAVGELARQAYMGAGLERLSLALGARSPEDFTSALQYTQSVGRSEHHTLETLDAEQQALANAQARLTALGQEVLGEQRAATHEMERTEAAAAAADQAHTSVQHLIVARTRALDDAEKLKAAIEAEFAAEEAESKRLAKVIAQRAAAALRARRRGLGPVDLGGGILSFPVIGPITSPFGMRYHPILHRWKVHTGTDFGVPSGTAVRAAMDGVVIDTFRNSAYGNRVIVDHGFVHGVYLVTTYNHLSHSTIHQGEHLKRGELLGYSGNTGWTTGPHLHFEVLIDGRFINPMTWLH